MSSGRRDRSSARSVRLHPRIRDASEGRLPEWATLAPERRAHAGRVAALLGEWAAALGRPARDVARWRAAGQLHDILKDADAAALRTWAGDDVPAPLLHGLACAERLRREGVEDPPLLLAIGYHTTGHPDFTPVGEYLFLADFLEPGRRFRQERRRRLRERLPEDRGEVLTEVVALRLGRLLEARKPVVGPSVEFWNSLVGGGEPAAGDAAGSAAAEPDAGRTTAETSAEGMSGKGSGG